MLALIMMQQSFVYVCDSAVTMAIRIKLTAAPS